MKAQPPRREIDAVWFDVEQRIRRSA